MLVSGMPGSLVGAVVVRRGCVCGWGGGGEESIVQVGCLRKGV